MNDNTLLQSIQQRDEQAIGILMTKYSRLLWKITSDILCQIGSDADAEEVVADVFISIWQNPEAFDEKRSNLKNHPDGW